MSLETQSVTIFCILAALSFPRTQPDPFIPLPCFCCVENRLRLLPPLLKAEMEPLLWRVSSEWDTFHFLIFFPVGMQGVCFFFAWVTKQLSVEGGSCCRVTLCCLISLFFMFILWLSQQLSRGWALWSPTARCGAARVWHSGPFSLCFFPILLSERVSWGRRAGGNAEEENALNLNSNSNLFSVLCSPLWGKANKSLIFRYRGRQLEAHVFASLCHWPV